MTLDEIKNEHPIAAIVLRLLVEREGVPLDAVESLSLSALALIDASDHPGLDALLLMLPPPERGAC